jgi:integrase
MLLLTGARAKETSLLKWSDYHAEAGLVYFADTKTGKPLEIPLCKYLLDMLENRRIYFYEGDDSKYIFSSYSGKGRIKSVRTGLKVVEDKSGIRTTLHDLRRSYLTYCENLDISSYTRKRLVNHSIPTDVTEKYTQFSIDRLKTVVESVAEYILINAGVMEQKPQAVLSDKQKIQIQSTAFWKSLSKRQQQLFAKDFSN